MLHAMTVIGLYPILINLLQILRPHRAHALAMTWQGIHTSPTSNLEGCHLSTNSAHGTCSREPKRSTIQVLTLPESGNRTPGNKRDTCCSWHALLPSH